MLATKRIRLSELLWAATAPSLSVVLVLCFALAGIAQVKDRGAWALRECWRYKSTELEPSAAASDGTYLYIGERGGRVSAVAADDGKRVWTSEVGGELVSNLLVIDRELQLVMRSAEGLHELRTLSVVSGIASRSVLLPVRGQIQIYSKGHNVVIVSDVGDLVAVDQKADKPVWTKKLTIAPKVVILGENALVAGFDDGRVSFIDLADGKVIRTITVKFVPSALMLSGDHLVLGDERGNITNLDVDRNTPVWTFKSGGKISGIYPIGDSEILVTSFDNFTYLLNFANGHVVWKRREPSRILETAIVKSNYAGVTPFGEASVLFFDPDNGKSLGQIVMPNSLEFIQPPQLVGDSVVTFTTEGLVSTGFFGCKRNEKAEAKTSAFK
jgi:outer membrane protein assembly factor BamB